MVNLTAWGTELRRARDAAGLSLSDVATAAGVSRSTVIRAESDTTDTGIATYAKIAQVCGVTLHLDSLTSDQDPDAPPPPTTYRNARGDDPWDNDAVQWLLTHDHVMQEGWTRQILLECLRRQPHRLRTEPRRVADAAALADKFGVRRVEVYDPKIGKTIIRLRRTDDDAPLYPRHRRD